MSEATTSTTMVAEAAPERNGTRLYWAASLLALAGAALVATAVWLPWAIGTYTDAVNGQQQTATLQISASAVDGVLGLAPWSVVTVLGVPLCCFFSMRGPRLLRVCARGCFLLWVFAILGIITPTLITLLTANPVQIRPVQGLSQLTVAHSLQPAMILTYLGILLALLAAVLGFMELRDTSNTKTVAAHAPVARKASASGPLTLSAVLVLLGIFVMPWATVNCTQTPLFLGQCTGVSYAGATTVGIQVYATIFDPLAARYAIPALLAGGALLMLLGIWRRDLFRLGGLWLVLWLLLATLFAVLGDIGTGAIVANAPAYGLPGGKWSGDTGIVAAFLGLLIGWGAALYLGIISLRASGVSEGSTAA